VVYTCVFWKLSGKYFAALFPLFQIYFVWSVQTICLGTSRRFSWTSGHIFWLFGRYGFFVRTFLVIVWTAVFSQPFTWHNVRTLLMFRPNSEPCRVKSFSPHAAALLLGSFWLDFVVLCFFSLCFYAKLFSARVKSAVCSPPQVYSYSFTTLFLSFLA
jgi:glycerol uptake facilitator-like aquaporin